MHVGFKVKKYVFLRWLCIFIRGIMSKVHIFMGFLHIFCLWVVIGECVFSSNIHGSSFDDSNIWRVVFLM